MKKLRDIEAPLANFFASGVLKLEEKLGPFLWQFPASWRFDPERLDAFFRMLPRDFTSAAALAEEHDARLIGRSFTEPTHTGPLRHAVEVRNESFFVPEMIALLRRHQIAWVIADTAGVFPYAEDLTADFLYVRLHGSETLYGSGYSGPELERWAQRIRRWRAGQEPADAIRIAPIDRRHRGLEKDVYVYFDNTDVALRAPYDAMALIERLKLARGPQERAVIRERR